MTSPRTLLTAWNLHPKKQLGQNFLKDPSAIKMIVERAKITSDDTVLEIGAGLGALTVPLAKIAKKVYAVEKDAELLSLLKTELMLNRISNTVFIEKDILNMDIDEIAKKEGRKLIVMGNLPYNISSQVIVQLIKSRNAAERAVLMLQKELAERITASPGCKDYGRITVMLKYCSEIRSLANINSSLFFPRPSVDSEVIEIKFKEIPNHAKDEEFFFKVIKASFGQRRKTLKNAISGSELRPDIHTVHQILEKSGIDPLRRAETLAIGEFIRLSDNLYDVR